jgi:carboxylate-amine ligase
VPDVPFESSEPLTLGIEEEFMLLETADGVTFAPRARDLLEGELRTIASPGGWIKPELLLGSIEVATAPNRDLLQLDVDLRALRDAVVARARDADAVVAGIGMHPDLIATDELVTPTEAHQSIASLHERIGTLGDQVTHGIHVHVGMPSLDDAVRVMDALAGCVPLFVALTANSPVVRGQRAPWKSARSEVQRRMLWAGPTPRLAGIDEYRTIHALHQLENSGEQRFLWDVAPVPELGTVEVRSFDSHADAAVALGMAALVQAIASHVLVGGELPRASESLERHNRWSAMEFGVRARFLVAGRDSPVDAANLVRDLVELVAPHAQALGNAPWLSVIDDLLTTPPVEAGIAAFESGGVRALLAGSLLSGSEPGHDGA